MSALLNWFKGVYGAFGQSDMQLRIYRTSSLVWKSGKFSKSRLFKNRMFSLLDVGLLTLPFKNRTKKSNFFFNPIWSRIFWHQIRVHAKSGPAGTVLQIWVSGPILSGNSYAQSGLALHATCTAHLISAPD